MNSKKIKVSKGTEVEVLTEMDERLKTQQEAHDYYLASKQAVRDYAAFLNKEIKKIK